MWTVVVLTATEFQEFLAAGDRFDHSGIRSEEGLTIGVAHPPSWERRTNVMWYRSSWGQATESELKGTPPSVK